MKRILHNMSAMGELPYFLLRCGLLLACAMAASALVVIVFAGAYSVTSYPLYHYADQMLNGATALLFVAVLGSAVLQDMIPSKTRR